MRERKTLRKADLFRAAVKKSLFDFLVVSGICFVFLLAVYLVARISSRTTLTVLQLLCLSFFEAAFIFIVCAVPVVLIALSSLRLLNRQEKLCCFSFADEELTWENIPSDWYINCSFSRVIAVRRGYILKAAKPEYEYRVLYRMKVKDVTGQVFYLKGTFQQLEGLRVWLRGADKTEE